MSDVNFMRQKILAGARSVFMNLGFDGASMSEIAHASGVSKATLYVYFTDKTALFNAIIEQQIVEFRKMTFDFNAEADVKATLCKFGCAYVQFLCGPIGSSSIRTVAMIAERMPEVGCSFYQNIVEDVINRLAAYLECKAQSQDLKIDNCTLAAAQFMQICQATIVQPYIFQARSTPTDEEILEVVENAAAMFLARYENRDVTG